MSLYANAPENDNYQLTAEQAAQASRFRIADTHCHIYPAKIAEKATGAVGTFYEIPMYAHVGDSQTLLANGAAIGVERYVVCSVATKVEQVDSISRFIAQECQEHPQFVGLGAWHQDVEDVDALLDKTQELGLKGIKVHPDFQKVDIEDPSLIKLYAALQERGMVLLIHMGDPRYDFSRPAKLARVLERFDRLKVDAAHFGGYGCWDEALSCLAGSPAYYDVSSSLMLVGTEKGRELVDGFGVDKLMFGVDFPMWNHSAEFARVMQLGLDDQQLQALFYDNFARLYGEE